MDMSYAAASDVDRMEREQVQDDAAETFGFYITRLYRDLALLAEALGLLKLSDEIRQTCPKGKNAYELKREEDGLHSDHLRHARHSFNSLEKSYLGQPLSGLSVFETIMHSSGKIIAATGKTPVNEAQARAPVFEVLGFCFSDAVREIHVPKPAKTYKPAFPI